jgi:hypothetical protein
VVSSSVNLQLFIPGLFTQTLFVSLRGKQLMQNKELLHITT